MRKEYYEIYRELYDIYRFNQSDPEYFGRRIGLFRKRRLPPFADMRTVRMIDNAIIEAQGELGLGDRVRPDARLFLLVNLHQMVALPVAGVSGRYREPQSRVEEYVRQDVRDILEAAKEESKDAEVSGHAVVGALARIWEKLQINKLEVWG
jgi:hypothetical protein